MSRRRMHQSDSRRVAPADDAVNAASSRLNLSVHEAAAALSVSPRTVRKLIAQSALPVVRIGRRVLIPLAVLREWNVQRISRPNE